MLNKLVDVARILKIERSDLICNSIESFHRYETCYSDMNLIVSELARYAMMDLSADHLGARDDFAGNPGDNSFHSLSLNTWVQKKAYALLLPFGVPETVVDRAVKSILGRTYDLTNPQEKIWNNEDKFQPDILKLGEIFRLTEGKNCLAPSRIITFPKPNYGLFISPYPTHMLRSKFNEAKISFTGILRTIEVPVNENLPDIQSQPVKEYANLPEIIEKIVHETRTEDTLVRKRMFKEYIIETFNERTREEFEEQLRFNEDKLSFVNKEQNSQHASYQPYHYDQMTMVPCWKILRMGEYRYNFTHFIATNKNFLSENDNMSRKEDTRFFELGNPELWKYITRLFNNHYPLIIRLDDNSIHLQKRPPASGVRLMNALGGKYIPKGLSKWNRGYYRFPRKTATNEVYNFLLKYCMYREE